MVATTDISQSRFKNRSFAFADVNEFVNSFKSSEQRGLEYGNAGTHAKMRIDAGYYRFAPIENRKLKSENRSYDPLGRVTTYDVYDNLGRLTTVKDYLNQPTIYQYDLLDRITKVTAPSGIGVISETAFTWNSSNNGNVMSITTTATKRPTTAQHIDAFGRTTRESEAGFNGTMVHNNYMYDQFGRLHQQSEPFTGTPRYYTYEYDAHDRLTKVTEPSGKITTQSYSGNTVTTVEAGISASKTFDASGALLQASDPAGNITYNLRPDGQPTSINAVGVITSFQYDTHGRQTHINDPSAGTIQYQYNSEGLLSAQINARNQTTTYLYTNWGQPLKIITPEQTIDYVYDQTLKYRLNKITAGANYEVSYGYDGYGRVNKVTEKEGTVTLLKDYLFEAGMIKTVKYNNVSADVLEYNYNTHGYLSNMKFGNTTIFTVNSRNHFGQLTQYTYGNSAVTNRTYTANGTPLTITATRSGVSLMNASYNFNDIQGTLNWRNDIAGGSGQENFAYDNLRRLTGITAKVNNAISINNLGNITSKTDAGTLLYENTTRPYQLTAQINFPPTVDTDPRTIVYTSDERPASIAKSGNTATFAYNHAGERTKMTMTGASNYTRIYLGGNYERETSGATTTERLYLGGTAYEAPAVAIRTNGGAWQIHYIHRDYLGSMVAISNAAGANVETRSYDAWGRLRNPSTLVPFAHNAQPALLLRRGYTGHEHLPELGLVNMNARLYDPVIGRFLAPDPYVQAPGFTQSFNRYAYCLNNPLIYIDPSGEKWWKWVMGAMFLLDPISATTSLTAAYTSSLALAGTAAGTAMSIDFTVTYVGSFYKGPQWGGKRFNNTLRIIGGLYKTDENKGFGHNLGMLASRWTWEAPQTFLGMGYTHTRNFSGKVDRVDYLGGATFATNENAGKNNGVSIGNYINMNIDEKITGNFKDYVISNPLFMHEYGHTIDSRKFGFSYLFLVGIPSVYSFNKNKSIENDPFRRDTHDVFWTETRANRHAEKYFRRHYNVNWDWENDGSEFKFYPLSY